MPSIYPNTPIILASGSQSRRVMLEDAGIHFSVISSNVDEDLLKKEMDGFPFEDQVVRLAAAKASEVSVNNPNHLIIGGDQMCIFQNKVFDKPGSQEKAIENLKLLSGTTHYQYSGVCLYKDGRSLWEYYEVVELNMHSLTEEEIINYVKAENPINAAGAYKFESLGCNLFSSVDGSSYTIRGMPLLPLLKTLREMKIISLENIE
ncbi:Maf family protein [Gammaproteobacteria bacterium]|jgi:septum formation protein|nr:Maf family protein [Gammaproteobacteria bacterium]MDA9867738.1 Maf family protein [Gammaproteobacteria bacterium]MDC0961915.1 Maf family protein [Gammaproteobacteria bacterium]MDC3216907.1 Maf family protein [Gammaproteobacteria bacterium]MDC3225859.1 Maf family protein [Gammaproteobacteria bacterium]